MRLDGEKFLPATHQSSLRCLEASDLEKRMADLEDLLAPGDADNVSGMLRTETGPVDAGC